MKRRDFLLAATAFAGATASGGGLVSTALAAATPDPLFSQAFPDAGGKVIPLDTFLGTPLVVNFWATWCPPCVKEMPDLQTLHKKHTNVGFLGLAVDTATNVVAFNEKVQVTYPLLMVGHQGIAMMREMGNKAGGLPFTILFDAKGRVVDKVLGQIQLAQLDAAIGSLSS